MWVPSTESGCQALWPVPLTCSTISLVLCCCLMWPVGNSRLYMLLTFYVDTECMETSTLYTLYMGAGLKELEKATVQSQPQSLFCTYSDRLAFPLVEHPSSLPGPKPAKGSHQIHLAREFPEQIRTVIVCLAGI